MKNIKSLLVTTTVLSMLSPILAHADAQVTTTTNGHPQLTINNQDKNANQQNTTTTPDTNAQAGFQSVDNDQGKTVTQTAIDEDTQLLSHQYYNDYGFSHLTRYNVDHMQDGLNTAAQNPIADFSHTTIKNVNVFDNRKGVKGQRMNVWDAWPLQDGNDNQVDFHGYHLMFALTGNPNKDYTTAHGQAVQDSRIFLYYQKIGQEKGGVKTWHSAGPVFNKATEGATDPDATLRSQLAQWSGETVQMPDHTIQMFYTTFNGTQGDDWQALAKAQLSIKVNKKGVYVNHAGNTNHQTIAKPDGEIYQKLSQSYNDNYDENVFRDAHYFTYQGKKYLMFAANTTDQNGPEGASALNNTAFIGGDSEYQIAQHKLLDKATDNPWYKPATEYNACFGVAELNNDYTVKKFVQPILGLNTVTDEFERPNLFEHNGKWYLFGITRGYKLATPNVNSSDSFLIGFVADSPFGKFKPLNDNGLVIRNTRHWSSRKYAYSFYVLNHPGTSNNFLVTSYMTNTKQKVGFQTFAPTMHLKINNDTTSVIKRSVEAQGYVGK